jgi:uncharacterized membrane protein
MRRVFTSLLVALGLGLSVYLAALKLAGLPCLGASGCHAVLHSRFGEIFRVPVGAYGAALWLAIILVPDRSKRGVLLLLMAGAAALFMLIQFAVLRGFCLYCTVHAAAAWGALMLHGEKPARWCAPLGLALAAGAFALTRHQAATQIAITTSAGNPAALHARADGFYWLAPFTDKSPALVLSLDCPACLDLLGELTRRSYADVAAGPALYFKTNEKNRALTEAFVAAVLAQETTPRDAFLAVTAILLIHKDAVLSSPDSAAAPLAAIFPSAVQRRDRAARLLADQATALHAAALGETTPLLVPRGGDPQAFFKTEELFPR